MRAYFPLPPSISIDGIKNKIIGSITFLNCPNNRLKPIFFNKRYNDIVYLGVYILNSQVWTLLTIKECKPFDFIELNRKQLNVEDHQMVVAVAKKNNNFQEKSKYLPEPDSLKIDNSIVEQRVSMNFSYLKSTTSYQGEYPFKMSTLKKGSLLSFDTIKDSTISSTKNFIILMNLSKNYSSIKSTRVKFFDPRNKEKFIYINAYRNFFTVIDKEKYEKLLNTNKTIFMTSELSTFIPILLCFNCETKQLSVEHTHPPSEYFFGPQKLNLVRIVKKKWIES